MYEYRFVTGVYGIYSLFLMHNFINVTFKMTEKHPYTGGSLEIWSSVLLFIILSGLETEPPCLPVRTTFFLPENHFFNYFTYFFNSCFVL